MKAHVPGKNRALGKHRLIDELQRRFPEKEREVLHAIILHGDVRVNGHRERDPKALLRSNARIDLASPLQDYASRGGKKLESVLQAASNAGFAYKDRVVLDAGASTGGFSDCLLRHGAAAIHAVDVGYNVLDYRLRSDERVHVHERCNIMALSRGDLQPAPESAVLDLSFRSIEGAASQTLGLLHAREPRVLALIKPQFELEYSGISLPNFSGVLHDSGLVDAIVEDLCQRLEGDGVGVKEMWPAGLRGSSGNQEFFALLHPLSPLGPCSS